MKDIVEAIENFQPANNRSQIKVTAENTLICDSYNANPTSMHSALESFAGIKAEKKTVILGDMLELGEKTEDEHVKLLNELKALNIDNALLVGPIFRKVALKSGFRSFPEVNSLCEYLKDQPLKGNTILIKGSRRMGLEKVYDML